MKCKHQWTDESVDTQGNNTCVFCGKSESPQKITEEQMFYLLDKFTLLLKNSDWAKGNIITNKLQLNEDTDYLVITDKAKKRIAKKLLKEI